jgi:hypothetical protein
MSTAAAELTQPTYFWCGNKLLQSGTSSNFREDINASGGIDVADVSIARQQTLTSASLTLTDEIQRAATA